MSDVVIAGIGQTPVGEHWELSIRELAFMAIEQTLQDAAGLRPQAVFVANMLAPILSRQSHLGTLVADFAGLNGVAATSVEAAGASGGVALNLGWMAVASGMVDTALVVGVEKMTDQVGAGVDSALATLTDSDYEAEQGVTPTVQAALLMQRYLYQYSPPREAFGGFPLLAHANGVHNPNAMFRRAISKKVYAKAGPVSAPLNVFDAAPDADGAAAVLLTRANLLPAEFPHPVVRIAGSSVTTDTLALHDRPNLLDFQAVRLSVERACVQAGIQPQQADFFELHDAYSIYAALVLEAAGFAEPGSGWQLAQNGNLALDGKMPICTLGGAKARGNPGGATGLYQAVEAALQLRGLAGENQISKAQTALIQCLGGPASTVATHILMRNS